MLERLIQQKAAVRRYIDTENPKVYDLQRNEWTLLEELIKLLPPIEKASKWVINCNVENSYLIVFSILQVCEDDSPLSVQIAMAHLLKMELQNASGEGVGTIKDELITNLHEKFDIIYTDK